MLRAVGSVTFLVLLMVGCGGGDSSSSPPPPPPPPPPDTYTVGGTVSGLVGSGLTLGICAPVTSYTGKCPQSSVQTLAIDASGPYKFPRPLPNGSAFNVGVVNQPTSSHPENCQAAYDRGTIGAANVTNVDVTCTSGYTVGGTVSGLVGSGLTLAICTPVHNGPGLHLPICNNLKQVISANGAFTLDSAYPAGYSGHDFVFIDQQPTSPTQRCEISNATVSIRNANDTSVTVYCAEYSYVTNAADDTLSAYSIDATTGALAAIGTPAVTGDSPHAIVGFVYSAIEDKRFIYVGNEGSHDVSAFAVNPTTGALTAVLGSPFAPGTDSQAMTLNGPYLYVANAGSGYVSVYPIDVNTGALTEPSTIATGKSPTSIVVDPFGGIVLVANHGGSNDISVFGLGLPLTLISSVPAGGNPLSLALGAQGRFLYSANPDAKNPSISGFSVDGGTGALSPLSGSPFPLPVSQFIATDQTGAYLYVTSGVNVVGYSIDATTGALTALSGFPVATGANAYSITIDPTNQFLYVTHDGVANVSGFTLDASTGALTPMAGSPFPAGNHPEFIAAF